MCSDSGLKTHAGLAEGASAGAGKNGFMKLHNMQPSTGITGDFKERKKKCSGPQ